MKGGEKHLKKYLLPVVLAAVVLGGLGVFNVQAAEPTTFQTSIVKRIAEKFNVSESEVQEVFDEERTTRENEMKKNTETKLSQAVADGKITEKQKKLILNKMEELKANRESDMKNFKNMTDEERHAAMEKKRTDLQTWAEQNGISQEYLMMGGHGKGKFMMKMN